MEISRIFDFLPYYQEKYPDKEDVFAGKENGAWRKYGIDEVIKLTAAFSSGLLELGLVREDKIASISNNRPEWNLLDYGMLQLGLVHVPIYPTISDDDYRFVLNHSEAKLVFISDYELYRRLKPIVAELSQSPDIYTFNKIEGAKHWSEIIEIGESTIEKHEIALKEIKLSIKRNDLATIIYTSGTTGVPKGVMLSHYNLVYNVLATAHLQVMDSTCKALSFLPLCHVYERMMNYQFQYVGISIYYAESIETIADNLKDVKPNGFNTVPRLLEKIYDIIVAKGKELSGIKRHLFFWSVNLGLRFELNHANGWWYDFKLAIARKLIFIKWKEVFGGNIRIIVTGGAAVQPRLLRIFWAADIRVVEGYGLTETSPVISVNSANYPDLRFGTVGLVINGIEVKIADDGEILCKGPNVMLGYYKNPEATKDVIDKEGWLHTGDIGLFEDGRFLKITDRKKEIFKTSGGKYIAPQVIENKLKESFFIEQVMVVGENQKFAGAIISPNMTFLLSWCERKGLHFTYRNDLVHHPDVVARYRKEVETYNATLGKTEQVKDFRLVADEWTPNSGALSPTLKLKRKVLAKRYEKLISDLYAEKP